MTNLVSFNCRRCITSSGARGSRRWEEVSTPTIRKAARINRKVTSERLGLSLTSPLRSPGKMKDTMLIILQAILDTFRLSQFRSLLIAPTPKKEDSNLNILALITHKKSSPTFASLAINPFARSAPSTACTRTTRCRPQERPSSKSEDCCRRTSKNWINRRAISWPRGTRERSKVESGAKTAERIKNT